jgi:hypothetical protein
MAGGDVTRQYKDNKLSKIAKKWNFFHLFFQSSMDEVPGATKENSYRTEQTTSPKNPSPTPIVGDEEHAKGSCVPFAFLCLSR